MKRKGSRQAPVKSATLFKEGTKKLGLDGEYYYVTLDKNKRKCWTKEAALFVVYKMNLEKTWKWPSLGRTKWEWIGGGQPFTRLYPRDDQFNGNPKHKSKVKEILVAFFKKLKQKGVVLRFRVVSSTGLRNMLHSQKR